VKRVRTTLGIIFDTLSSLLIYALIAGAILFMAGQVKHYYNVGYGIFTQQGKDATGTGKVVQFTVEENMTASSLGKKLEEAGLIESSRLFLVQEKVSDYSGMYVPGTYALSSEMTPEEILRVISGAEVSPYAEPAPEGAAEQEAAK
jgi:UPF0755 protein